VELTDFVHGLKNDLDFGQALVHHRSIPLRKPPMRKTGNCRLKLLKSSLTSESGDSSPSSRRHQKHPARGERPGGHTDRKR